MKMEIYFDTCVYCRPFDDQTQNRIKKETAAFVNVLKLGEMGIVTIVSSDVLNLRRIKRYGSSKG